MFLLIEIGLVMSVARSGARQEKKDKKDQKNVQDTNEEQTS
jgi:hypothetical protein